MRDAYTHASSGAAITESSVASKKSASGLLRHLKDIKPSKAAPTERRTKLRLAA